MNVQAKGHKDVHNVRMNLVAPLSAFKDGGLDVDTEAGPVTVELMSGPKFFNPKDTHTKRQWSNGNRAVLLAYPVRDSAKLSKEHVGLLKDIGFQWTPHSSKPFSSGGDVLLKTMRVGLIRKPARVDSPDSSLPVSPGGSDIAEELVSGQNQRREGESEALEQAPEPLEHIRQDLDLVLQDLEDRAARLRDLLEEEEILSEEYRRVGEEARGHLGDARE